MKVTRTSQITGKTHTMDLNVTIEQMNRLYARRELAQDIFPDLPKEEREFLISGITPQEWKETFGSPE